ncbi:CPBP family intramembrane metalloprotease [Leuconostoc mesenteroides]|nr:CPBP family intramembrane glutamic endopeptidase [Leuconostoc mesenteroides]WJM74098.1 CPBP family intramembrane metalloprotease [Leuconostoc mesenteroides]
MASIASALGAAIFEEMRDRGFGGIGLALSIENSQWKPMFIAIVTSFIFSITHYFNLLMPNAPTLVATNQQVVSTFFLGMTSIVLYMRTGSIFYSILIHFLNNFTFWTPTSDLSQDDGWASMLIFYALIPGLYSLWCLRPKKSEMNLKYLPDKQSD